MDLISTATLHHLFHAWGLWVLFAVITFEAMGVPMPGESALVAAALYAASTGQFGIVSVVLVAAAGAILGDNIGYLIGRTVGAPLVARYGRYVGLHEARLKVGQYLFLRHGGKVVFFGRFVAVLRVLAAVLAGVNRMDWRRFLFANAAGAILWACVVGFAAYAFGRTILEVTRPIGIGLIALSAALIIAVVWVVRSHEAEFEARAEEALPGPLRPVHRTAARHVT